MQLTSRLTSRPRRHYRPTSGHDPPLASTGAARVRLPARLLACGRAPVHLRGAGRRRLRARSCRSASGAARPAASSSRSESSRRRGSRSRPRARCSDTIPPALVELALWVADYYGTTPARALELVAPLRRSPRGERPSPAERDALPAEKAPGVADRGAGGGRRAGRRRAGHGRRAASPPRRADRERQDRGLSPRDRGGARARARRRSCSCPRSRSRRRPSGASASASATPSPMLHSALGQAERRDERDRIARGEARVVVGARSAIFAPIRGLGLVVVDEEHDCVVQAGVRSALRRAHRGGEARRARRRRRPLRERHAAARELGAARADRPQRHGSAPRSRGCGSSTSGARAATRSRRRS